MKGSTASGAYLIFASVLLLVALAVILTACGTDKNASISRRDNVPANVLNMPDGWSNVAMKCDGHGHRVFTTDHGDSYSSAVAVIADPTCGGNTP